MRALSCGILILANAVVACAQDDGQQQFQQFGIYRKSAPRPETAEPTVTRLPLQLQQGERVALIGNGLLEQMQHAGHFETLVQQRFPQLQLAFRNLAWSADTPELQPRPENFADTQQHLLHERADVIFAAYGFNESFDGLEGRRWFYESLSRHVASLKSKAFNGRTAPRIVLVSPIANQNVPGVPAADLNNDNLQAYAAIVKRVAMEQNVGFADMFDVTLQEKDDDAGGSQDREPLTFNGVHLTEEGYRKFARALFQQTFQETPSEVNEKLRAAVVDKNRQFFRRFRPVNTFYYTGGRKQSYGYLDFLPAMRNFDLMTANRDRGIWSLAAGRDADLDDSNVPPLPESKQSRGANRWMTAEAERKEFRVDPRFDVELFAGEEQFPDIAAPIQMRWDARGRLWVSCSTTYPHVYPGNEPDDKLAVLEDADGDGKADTCEVFADDLHIPLSFEFGDGGVYVSEMPHLTFLKDTDGDGRADQRRILLTGFGTEDSHHALHDFTWTPDGDLLIRESIFHHSQIETPYGPVRQNNSGWFLFDPQTHRLTSFGSYHSTNPWGVTFDDWGRHVASHPIFAAAFHSLDPPYPQQHPRPAGLRAYSGTCGQEFVDFGTFPDELQGGFIKVRYKPTNRVEIHDWVEGPFGFDEQYRGDLLFSSNLSFIPVDIRFGPRGALYVCDWYNPIKGHAQYSLRDDRRDRHSGRIWRITAKGRPLQQPAKIAGASIPGLLELLKRPEYRIRYWAKRELRDRDHGEVRAALDDWVARLDRDDPRLRHDQIEAIWALRGVDGRNLPLLRELLSCDNRHARAAAVQQLRHWHAELDDAAELLRSAANDPAALVRMEAAIAASWIGTPEALDAMLDIARHPRDGHLLYAFTSALGAHTLRRHWEASPKRYPLVPQLLAEWNRTSNIKAPKPTAEQARFDRQGNLKTVRIGCVPERMRFTVEQFTAAPGQPLKIVFYNNDATDHNFVLVRPGKLAEVGIAANEMARDPRNAQSDFIPESKLPLILQASPLIGPTRKSRVHALRFEAPAEPGLYPYVCTFPGHWVMMNGVLVVAGSSEEAEKLLAARQSAVVNKWTMADFDDFDAEQLDRGEPAVMRGMRAFMKARCNQCHVISGHGIPLGPELTKVAERLKGRKLLQQLIEPSSDINKQYRTHRFQLRSGRTLTGVIVKDEPDTYHVVENLLTPHAVKQVPKQEVARMQASPVSPMPLGLADTLTKQEIYDLLVMLEAGGMKMKH